MGKKMLIDAAHPEETRVVVVNGNRIEEFDFEAAAKKPLKGNIYLAKVTRVEPSLQAAFVDFGGNRHGFLAFNEIHPDYYQIPVADRQRLMAAERAVADRLSIADEEPAEPPRHETEVRESAGLEGAEPGNVWPENTPDEAADGPAPDSPDEEAMTEAQKAQDNGPEDSGFSAGDENGADQGREPRPAPPVAAGGAGDDIDDAFEEARGRRVQASGRPYKIHEVIKRRQILLVQVVKEERGNKGAALTTYLSLAGRYCVLMPNTARGGGISRKITQQADRKRLKAAVNELEIPPGIGLIIRTAGANRTKAEVKRDYEYLLRVWENVRDLTLKSIAPALVYEEGNLIKRAIRDLYSKEIESILVDGDEGYKDAKAFMRTLMPSHAKVVQPYKDRIPLFQRYQVESLLDQMFQPIVHLRSGGYIVINQTEALVAIDVNSGRATREHSIEETALRTNLEAAEEAARQLRLRDLAGLIVIDFIDMEEGRNNRAVEKRLKECLKSDRARIQVGRISSFGLLEMSRQRLRAGVLEGSTNRCPHCEGSGIVRSVESQALRALRVLEEEGLRDRTAKMILRVPPNVALYILNYKRADILEIEQRYRTSCIIESDDALFASGLELERAETREPGQAQIEVSPAVRFEAGEDLSDEEPFGEATEEEDMEAEGEEPLMGETADAGERKRRRRRRRRSRRGDEARGEGPIESRTAAGRDLADNEEPLSTGDEDTGDDRAEAQEAGEGTPSADERARRRRRRRGRRGGGRRNQERNGELLSPSGEQTDSEGAIEGPGDMLALEPPIMTEAPGAELLFVGEREPDDGGSQVEAAGAPPAEPPQFTAPDLPTQPELQIAPEPRAEPEPEDIFVGGPAEPEPASPGAQAQTPAEPARRGWWQRRFGG